jgi:Flp pilus assembly protein TadB
MRGALITVRCDCGQIRYLAYGEGWVCEGCGRRWNTGQIPAEEYWGIMHEMRRYRLLVMGMAIIVAVVGIALGALVGAQFFVLMPALLGFWFLFYMPRWRQKVRARSRSLPTWKLHPE